MLKRFYILCLFLMYVSVLKAQVFLGGGLNSVAAFGIKNPYLGMNLLGEYRQDDLSYFVKYFTSLPQTDSQVLIPMDDVIAGDFTSNYTLNSNLTYRYSVLELGKRYYYGKDLDFGPATYFSSHLALIMNEIKLKNDSFDETKYRLPSDYIEKGKLYALAAGLNAGLQYSFYYGTFFADCGLNYVITVLNSPTILQQSSINDFSSFKQLFFVFNFGFKKTIFVNY